MNITIISAFLIILGKKNNGIVIFLTKDEQARKELLFECKAHFSLRSKDKILSNKMLGTDSLMLGLASKVDL